MILQSIYTAPAAGSELTSHQSISCTTKNGIDGDRYQTDQGYWSDYPDRTGICVTLISVEHLDQIKEQFDVDLTKGQHRRNLEVTGGDVLELLGKKFRLGSATLEGIRICPACGYLSQRVGVDTKKLFEGFGGGGLRADVIEGGTFSVGDKLIQL